MTNFLGEEGEEGSNRMVDFTGSARPTPLCGMMLMIWKGAVLNIKFVAGP